MLLACKCLHWKGSTRLDVFVGDSESRNRGEATPQSYHKSDREDDCNFFHHFSIIIALNRPNEC
jgi:hypothetical protein